MKKSGILRRVFAVGLSAAVAACTMAVPAFAATPTQSGMIEMYVSSGNQYTDAAAALAAGFLAHSERIDIKAYSVPKDSIGALLTATLARYPELFFVERQFSYYTSGSNISYFVPTYTYSASQTKTMLTSFYAEADKYLAKAQGKLSKCGDDFSRAVVLHDELVLDAAYNINNSSPYNFMIDKSGVCETYARVYAYLLAQCGIKSEIVDSDSMVHEWLMVKLDGSYYHVDITWDDPTPNKPGKAVHSYFLLSENAIKTSSDITKHTGFTTVNKATSTKYDSYAMHGFESKMCKLDPDDKYVYAIGSSGIVKYNYSNNTSTNLLTISDKWYVSGSSGSYYTGIYSGLDNNNGLLYYNTPSKIYSFDPDTKKSTAVYTNSSSSQKIYGVRIRDNKLYAVLSSGANSAGTETYVKDLPEETATDPVVNNSTVSSTTITLGSSITFKGAASGGSGGYTYTVYNKSGSSWTKIGSGTSVTYTPTAAGTYTFKETVTDSDGDTADKTFTVTVNPKALKNTSTVSSTSITLGDTVSITASASDGTGGYTYAIYMKAGTSWIKIGSSTTASYRPTAAGTSYFKTTVTDSSGTSVDKEFSVTVNPAALSNESTINKTTFENGEDIVVTGGASGGTGGYTYSYYYRWYGDTAWEQIADDASSITVSADPGKWEIKVTAKDSNGSTADKVFTITINADPVVNNSTINKTEFIRGESITVTGAAEGGTGSYTYTYYYRYEGESEWTKLTSGSSLTFAMAPGKLDIKVTATDTDGASDDKIFAVTVSYPALVNNSTISKELAAFGDEITVTGAAEGGSGSYTYSYKYRAAGASGWTDLGTGSSFTFTAAPGEYEISAVVTDAECGDAEKTFTVTVAEQLVNDSAIDKTLAAEGEDITVTGAAEGGIGSYTYTYEYKADGDDTWTELDADTSCVLTLDAGTYTIAVTVKDEYGSSAKKEFSVTVEAPAEPLVNNSRLNSELVTPNTKIWIYGAAEGGKGSYTYTFKYKRTTSRVWTVLAEDTDNDTTCFTPGSTGIFDLTVIVKDSEGTEAEKNIVLTVADGKSTAFKNTSTISTTGAAPNTKIWLNGSAEGSSGYRYAFYYKRTNARNWTILGTEFGTETTFGFTPRTEGEFNLKIDIIDENNEIVSRVYALSIIEGYKDTGIVNKSSVNETTIKSGSKLVVNGAAEGGTAPFTYAYYYKRAGAANWTVMSDFTAETSRSVTLRTAGDYIVKVAVKDSAGGMTSTNFDVTVTA